MHLDAEILLRLHSRRIWFCAQTHACKCRHTHANTDTCMQMQMHSRGRMQTHAKLFSCSSCTSCYMFRPWVSLPANPCPMLVRSFSRSGNTVGTRLSVSETPPTNLQYSKLAYPWEAFLYLWICFIDRSWLYNGLYLVLITCIWPKINTVDSG